MLIRRKLPTQLVNQLLAAQFLSQFKIPFIFSNHNSFGTFRNRKPYDDGDGLEERNPPNEGFESRSYQENDRQKSSLRSYNEDRKLFDTPKRPVEYPAIKRNFLTEKKLYSDPEIKIFREQNDITVRKSNGELPQPIFKWSEFEFPKSVLEIIQEQNFAAPTPIQSQIFPIILSGQDLITIAETGSGKTVGFILPGLVHILDQQKAKRGEGPTMLIMSPTRELAMQIYEQVKLYCPTHKSVCVYGGADRRRQVYQLNMGVDIVIATPGRLIDFIQSKSLSLNRVSFLVLDEADRMLDMGFEPQVRTIVDQIRPDRQTTFFSATWPKEVQTLAKDFCSPNAAHIQMGSASMSVNKNITQSLILVNKNDKKQKLIECLDKLTNSDKVLIFAQTKRFCEELSKDLTAEGFFCLSLHGDKSQQQRDYVMNQFKTSKARLLCATDVASRGLDVRDISLVVNYDVPQGIEDYVHRIGRTGRAGDLGKSITFFTSYDDQKVMQRIVELAKDAQQEVPSDVHEFIQNSQPHRQSSKGRYSKHQSHSQSNFSSSFGSRKY